MGERVKTYMMTELAEKLGISKGKLSQYLNGYPKPDGTREPPRLIEGVHYRREWRDVKPKPGGRKKNAEHKYVVVFTIAGKKEVQRLVKTRVMGRPKGLIKDGVEEPAAKKTTAKTRSTKK